MIAWLSFLVALLWICGAQAQTIGVILNSGGTAVIGANPAGTQISTSDSRWLAWQAIWGPNGSVAAAAKYDAAYAALIAPGFALTSAALSCVPCYFPVDQSAQSNYSAQYQSIVNDAIVQGSISGTTFTPTAVISGAIGANEFVYGSNVAPGTEITGGSGSSWTVNTSQTISSEYLFIGGLGTGWVTGSAYPVSDVGGALHSMSPVTFMQFRTALGALAACSRQAWAANGGAFPASCNLAATIP